MSSVEYQPSSPDLKDVNDLEIDQLVECDSISEILRTFLNFDKSFQISLYATSSIFLFIM